MNPIDIRYHMISLVAVFLALGVGILVGSNTNFFNINSIIEKQGMLIQKLEKTHKDFEKRLTLDKMRIEETDKYVAGLEQKVIPALMRGRIAGMPVGIIYAGDFSKEPLEENKALEALDLAGSTATFKIKLSLDSFERLMAARKDKAAAILAAELVRGAAYSSEITMQLQAEGSVLSGDFQVPAQGIVFVLGEGIDAKQAAKTLLPLQLAIQAEKAVAVSVVTGSNDSYRKMLATSKESMPVIQEIEKVTMQVDLVNMLAKQYDAARQAQAAQSAKANQPEPVPANAGHSSSRRRSR